MVDVSADISMVYLGHKKLRVIGTLFSAYCSDILQKRLLDPLSHGLSNDLDSESSLSFTSDQCFYVVVTLHVGI